VRSRCFLFFLAFALLDGATPLYAALGDAPRCLLPPAAQGAGNLASLNPPIPVLKPALAHYDSEERDYLVRTMVFEASGEPEEGNAAVAHVILNRERLGRWGDNIKEVVTRPWQFEPWMTRRKEIESLSEDDPRYLKAARIADAVLSGQKPDPTAGATHFLNPTIVRQRRGGSLPRWAVGEGQPIGRHTFYSPNDSGAVPQQAALPAEVAAKSPLILPRTSAVDANGRVGGGCRQDAITATSPALPADNIVQVVAR
jgi:N-acetylmuramoyl-L-alanine amidase